MVIFFLDKGLEVDHGVELLRRVAQQRLEVAHEPVHVPVQRNTVRSAQCRLAGLGLTSLPGRGNRQSL